MEAVAVSAVVSMTLKVIGKKLVPLLINEFSSTVGVKRDLQELQSQVEDIDSWLETRYVAAWSDPTLKWLKRLKDVAYAVDDVVDEFQMKAEEHNAFADGGITFKYMCSKPKSFIFQYKAARKIKAVKKKFAAIVKQRTDFSAIANSLPIRHPVLHITTTSVGVQSLTNVDVELVLGRSQEKHDIISKLVENNCQQKFNIVSVIGLGGSGKTTMARLVHDDDNIIKKHFEVILWVDALPEFGVHNLLGKLFESFSDDRSECHPMHHIVNKISDKLSEGKFLLVLDNVWIESRIQWEDFMVYLKSGAPGSAILLTTRNKKVAEAVRSTHLYDLPFLSKDASWQLFQQSLVMPVQDLDSDFVEVGKEIVNKCGGVPLAIKVLAGVVHDKERIDEWKAIRDNNILDVEGEEHRVAVSLMLSYSHLPPHLKHCFNICSVFPKGHMIDKEQLIDQWIAHDMITPVDGVDNLEHIGHKYFSSLVQVYLLQDVQEYNGRVRCRMHDLVHDLGRRILHDEVSVDVPKEANSCTRSYRYFSLSEESRHRPPMNVFRKARAVYIGKGDHVMLGEAMKNAKHLRSITAKYICTVIPKAILEVQNLRYLHVSGLHCRALNKSIFKIWSLQVLHATDCPKLRELPKSIGKLKKLRSLNLSHCKTLKTLPDSIGDCRMLSSLDLNFCTGFEVLPDSIGRNKMLRVLRLRATKLERLPPSITALENLERLELRDCVQLKELPDAINNLKKLEVLDLHGCIKLEGMPIGIGQLRRLQELGLFVVGDNEKSSQVSELGNMNKIGGILTISNIARVANSNDAHGACLKQKTNLEALALKWRRNDSDQVEEEEEMEQASFNGLEPPSMIKRLVVNGYTGGLFPPWIPKQAGGQVQGLSEFTSLTTLGLWHCPKLKHLQGLAGLAPHLRKLILSDMPALESISGGSFPSLVELTMIRLASLGQVWLVTERTLAGQGEEQGQMQIGSWLSVLKIEGCPNLKVKPYLPASLKVLFLEESTEELLQRPREGQDDLQCLKLSKITSSSSVSDGHGWELLRHTRALKVLDIIQCDITELPDSMRRLTSLQYLGIEGCSAVRILPEWLGELCSLRRIRIIKSDSIRSLPRSMGHMMALKWLEIVDCDGLTELPESMRSLASIEKLVINGCSAIGMLPECLGDLCSLQNMEIINCGGLRSLPRSIGGLTSLRELRIEKCNALARIPQGLGGLRSLRKLSISGLTGLTWLPESLCHLTSLKQLIIGDCKALSEFPTSLGDLCSLQAFIIWGLPTLRCLPVSIARLTSLEMLSVINCKWLKSVPDCKYLQAGRLRYLNLYGCPELVYPPINVKPLRMGLLHLSGFIKED